MNILYIAFSCSPLNGSEDQIGWNIPVASQESGNKVYVLTKSQHKKVIEDYLKLHPECGIRFFYIDIPDLYKRIFKGTLFTFWLRLWQKRAFLIAKKLVYDYKIDLVHQITPISFRAWGNYGNISSSRFVIGPIGGGYSIPAPLAYYARKHRLEETYRTFINEFAYFDLKINNKIRKSDYIWMSNYETKKGFERHHFKINNDKVGFQCDVGIKGNDIAINPLNKNHKKIIFFVPAQLVYRKGHELLFDAIMQLTDIDDDYEFRIAGEGKNEAQLKAIVDSNVILKKHIIFLGKIPYTEIKNEYINCDVVVLPSLREATGTVLLEGLAYGRAIMTGKFFGAILLADDKCAWLYYGNTREDLVKSFSKCIKEAIENPQVLNEKKQNAIEYAKKYTWEQKVKQFNLVYKNILENEK